MIWEHLFGAAGKLAMLGWLSLIFLPRWNALRNILRFGLVGVLAVCYSALVFIYFSRADGGGFATLAQVQILFASKPLLLAGWIHYLAFDLFIGTWLSERLDAVGFSRFLQAPILVATFLFGPFGLLLAFAPLAVAAQRKTVRR